MPNQIENFGVNESQGASSPNFDVDLRSERPSVSDSQQNSIAAQTLPNLEITMNEEDREVCHGPVCFGDSRYVPVYSTTAYADNLFSTFDTNNDKFVTGEELDAYETKFAKSIDELERARLDDLRANIDDWQKRSNDEFGFENSGVTKNDISEVKKAERNAEVADRMTVMIDKQFDDMDTNRDGRLTSSEVNHYKDNTRLERVVTDREALEQLAGAADVGPITGPFPSLASLNPFRPSGISKQDAVIASDVVRAGVRWDRD